MLCLHNNVDNYLEKQREPLVRKREEGDISSRPRLLIGIYTFYANWSIKTFRKYSVSTSFSADEF